MRISRPCSAVRSDKLRAYQRGSKERASQYNNCRPHSSNFQVMYSLSLLDFLTLTWVAGVLLIALLIYHITTKADIPKIRGIPEIPGALPMYSPYFFNLKQVLDIFSNLVMYISRFLNTLITGSCDSMSEVVRQVWMASLSNSAWKHACCRCQHLRNVS